MKMENHSDRKEYLLYVLETEDKLLIDVSNNIFNDIENLVKKNIKINKVMSVYSWKEPLQFKTANEFKNTYILKNFKSSSLCKDIKGKTLNENRYSYLSKTFKKDKCVSDQLQKYINILKSSKSTMK